MHPLNPRQVQAYLRHLDSPAPRVADRAALDRLIQAQLRQVPFENVDVLLGRPIQLDAEAVFAKVVERGRGGYCFEINSLFARLLLGLGYSVSLLGGRVRWGLPVDAAQTLLSHLLLRVELDEGSFIVDIGFGGPAPLRALPLHGRDGLDDCPYRLQPLAQSGETYQMQVLYDGDWATMYHFDLQPQAWVDHIARSWYTATHPDSIFLKMLMVARTDGDTRLSLGNTSFSRRHADGRLERTQVDSADALIALLRHEFHLDLHPEREEAPLRQRLQALLHPTPPTGVP
ncbi:MAG: arylamine N-acetyltransferase [Pseudomonadota bacterium]